VLVSRRRVAYGGENPQTRGLGGGDNNPAISNIEGGAARAAPLQAWLVVKGGLGGKSSPSQPSRRVSLLNPTRPRGHGAPGPGPLG
jgi:hypothetical protein